MSTERIFAALAAVLMVSSCTNTQRLEAHVKSVPEAERGYAIGRFAVEGMYKGRTYEQVFLAMAAEFRSTSGPKFSAALHSGTGNTVHDFELPDQLESGYFFCLPLPAGSYSFFTYRFSNVGVTYTLYKENEFDLPFQLARGEVAYLGRLKLTTNTGKNIFGGKMNAPGVLFLSSNYDADVEAALRKCPEAVRARPVRDASLAATLERDTEAVRRAASP